MPQYVFTVYRALFQVLNGSTYSCEGGDDVVALVKFTRYHDKPKVLIDAVIKHYEGEGIDVGNTNVQMALSENHYESYWLRLICVIKSWSTNPSANIISVLSRYPPGSTLSDKNGRYWVGRSRMIITRHRFTSCVGDDQEKMSRKFH